MLIFFPIKVGIVVEKLSRVSWPESRRDTGRQTSAGHSFPCIRWPLGLSAEHLRVRPLSIHL